MKSIIIDAGHGGKDPGASGFGVREKDWSLKMATYIHKRLKNLGAKVAMTRTNDITLESRPRTAKIRGKYDICISCHWNSFNGSARGVETIHSIYSKSALPKKIADALVSATGLPLRRVFSRKGPAGDYYYMHRLTGTTQSIIVEFGFIDQKQDHDYYNNDANFKKAGEAVVKVLAQEVGVTYHPVGSTASKPKPSEPADKLYRVQVGAFSKKKNADAQAGKLREQGYQPFVKQDGKLYRVQVGAFAKAENARKFSDELARKGFDTYMLRD